MGGIFFSDTRSVELSTLDFLQTQINASWSNVTILKSFTSAFDKDVDPPIVVANLDNTIPSRLEVGSDRLVYIHTIRIHIFGTSDAFRIDMAHFITDILKDGWTFNTFQHQSGNKTVLEKIPLGRIRVMTWDTNTKIDFGDNVDFKDRFRHLIEIGVRKFPD